MCLPERAKGATIQKLVTTLGSIHILSFGLLFGTTYAHGQLYQSVQTPLDEKVNANAVSWVYGCLFLGVAFGSITLGNISQKIGNKSVLLLCGLLQIGGWGCVHFATDIVHIYFSRVFIGVAAGASFIILPTFIQEISQSSLEAKLLAFIDQWRAFGIVVGFILGVYLDHFVVPLIGLAISMIFQLAFAFVQESPYYYGQLNDDASLLKSLRWYRGIRHIEDYDKPDFRAELEELRNNFKVRQISVPSSPLTYVCKMFLIVLILSLGAQLSGSYVLLTYGKNLLGHIPLPFSDTTYVFVLALVQFFGSMIASVLAPKTKRRHIFFASSLICSLSMIGLTLLIFFGNQLQLEMVYKSWAAMGLLWLHMLFSNIGLQSFVTIFITELLSKKLRLQLCSFVLPISWVLLFGLTHWFNEFLQVINVAGCFVLFAAVNALVLVCCVFMLPETLCRSTQDVQNSMGYVTSNNIARTTTVMEGSIKIEGTKF